MTRTKFFLTAIVLAGMSSLAMAQHGGHASGGGFGHAGHNPSTEDLQTKVKIQATDEQRAQLRTCYELLDRLRGLAADMKNPAQASGLDLGKARQQWSELLLHSMQSDHEAFVMSLNPDQQAALKDRLGKIDKARSELAARLQTMESDLAQTAPDAKRLANDAKEVDKRLKKLQKQHRELGSEIGVEG
jgi:chromosome segregation ATPase